MKSDYEYSLKYNASFQLYSQHSKLACAVQFNRDYWDHCYWKGFITLEDALKGPGYIACFTSGAGYKKANDIDAKLKDTPDNHSLCGYVMDCENYKEVQGILSDGKPYIVDLAALPEYVLDPNYEPPKVQKVFSLSARRIR